jgi:hypothetical protein
VAVQAIHVFHRRHVNRKGCKQIGRTPPHPSISRGSNIMGRVETGLSGWVGLGWLWMSFSPWAAQSCCAWAGGAFLFFPVRFFPPRLWRSDNCLFLSVQERSFSVQLRLHLPMMWHQVQNLKPKTAHSQHKSSECLHIKLEWFFSDDWIWRKIWSVVMHYWDDSSDEAKRHYQCP